MKLNILADGQHERGRLYQLEVDGESISVLLTAHALTRSTRWKLTPVQVLGALLLPEEVLRGHRNRFIAHRRAGHHVIRVVYEYEGRLPVVLTVYSPLVKRYFQGGGHHEDRILS
jgi:hypothetical protein